MRKGTSQAWYAAAFASSAAGATATLLPDGTVLIAGGETADVYITVGSAELFGPATQTFKATASMTAARNSHTATLLNNGKVLIAGGSYSYGDSAGHYSSAELYTPAAVFPAPSCSPFPAMARGRARSGTPPRELLFHPSILQLPAKRFPCTPRISAKTVWLLPG